MNDNEVFWLDKNFLREKFANYNIVEYTLYYLFTYLLILLNLLGTGRGSLFVTCDMLGRTQTHPDHLVMNY